MGRTREAHRRSGKRGSSSESDDGGSRRVRKSRKRKSTVRVFRNGVKPAPVVEKADPVVTFQRTGGAGEPVRVALSILKDRVPKWVKSSLAPGAAVATLDVTPAAWGTLREFFRGPPTPTLLAPTTDPSAAPGWLELAQVFRVEADVSAISEWLSASYSSAATWPQANAAAWAFLLAGPKQGGSSSSSSGSGSGSGSSSSRTSGGSGKYRLSERAVAAVAAGIAAGFRAPGVQAALPRFDSELLLAVLRTDRLETAAGAGEDDIVDAVGRWIGEDRRHRGRYLKPSALLDGVAVRFGHVSSPCLMRLLEERIWVGPKDDGYESLVLAVMSAMASKAAGIEPSVPQRVRPGGPPAAAPSLRVARRPGQKASGYISCASDDSSDESDGEAEPAICASAPPAPPARGRAR